MTTTYLVTVENIVCGKRHLRRVQAATSDEAGAIACEDVGGVNAGQYFARECVVDNP